MALLPTTYRYFDYNPSYSYPGRPASTPTSFENFVVPRAPANIRWPNISSSSMPHYIGNRRDIFGELVNRNMPSSFGSVQQGNQGLPPDVMLNLGLSLMQAGMPGGYSPNNFSPASVNGQPFNTTQPTQRQPEMQQPFFGGPPLFSPARTFRQTYFSPYQRIMRDYPYNWLLK